VRQRELDVRVVERRDVLALAVLGGDLVDRDDLERASAHAVTRRHLAVQRRDGLCLGQLTVLAVHVVRTRARVVAQAVGTRRSKTNKGGTCVSDGRLSSRAPASGRVQCAPTSVVAAHDNAQGVGCHCKCVCFHPHVAMYTAQIFM
jgi:hypothetical protein